MVAASRASATEDPGIADLSLEELTRIEVTSVAKRPQRLQDAPASVFVVSADDIRRSGATSLPEALRLAPNLEVARVNAYDYAISARGFNNAAGNKLQVLLDGRILYTPLFSGVFWDAQDVLLDDVERIEVISGPGATLWGANAVNGIINIITRRAETTRGRLARVDIGNGQRNYATRYGDAFAGASFRLYGTFSDRDGTTRSGGIGQHDDWRFGQAGFRADWGRVGDGFTLQGDAYRGTEDTQLPDNQHLSGANLMARWSRSLAPGNDLNVSTTVEHTGRDIPASVSESLNLYDLKFDQTIATLPRQILIWGAGYRAADDHVDNAPGTAFLPPDKDLHWAHLFVQDQIDLYEGRWDLVLGARLSDNTYTGIEFMPTVRLAWKPSPTQTLWGEISRAVRTPSRLDRELFSPETAPYLLAGGPGFVSEVSTVAELGYRTQPSPSSSLSVTIFHHDYDHLRSFERSPEDVFVIGNKMQGTGTGIEAWGSVQVTRNWRIDAGGFLLDQDLRLRSDSTDPTGVATAGNDPGVQWYVRSSLDLSRRVEIDVRARHVGALPSPKIPAYTAVDLRLGWHPSEGLEVALTGQNLFDPTHVEFGTPATASRIERAALLSVAWTF